MEQCNKAEPPNIYVYIALVRNQMNSVTMSAKRFENQAILSTTKSFVKSDLLNCVQLPWTQNQLRVFMER